MDLCGPLPSSEAEDSLPGLVLLYAPDYEALAPAYPFRKHEILIGRDESADIRIPGRAVSRTHACIRLEDGRWTITDLGGRNGTMVGGRFVGEAALEPHSQIRIGDAIFKLVAADAEGYLPYRIDGAWLGGAGDEPARERPGAGRIVGGYVIERLAASLREVARSDLSLLIGGESGTGKEVFARQLHDWSGRRGPFQAINCAAIPATLIEGELFGHRRGAFSGADRDRVGLIRAAHGGTLFLDEIGDMPPEAQAKLLRVLQSREIVPLGATQPEQVDVRVVCATHRDLVRLQRSEQFRGDLFARLNEVAITLPPLRERKEDLFALCRALAARHGRPDVRPTMRFMAALLHHDFPYNVRELEAIIKRWAAVSRGPDIDHEHLSDVIRDRFREYGVRTDASGARQSVEDAHRASVPSDAPAPPQTLAPPSLPPGAAPSEAELRDLLARHKGNVKAVACLLGKDRVQIHRWMKRYGINVDDYR
ncbi:MAG: sigma 54-interacting transcriptional regulator [Polyangiaceae bacterium]|nr:sigma 54-interacting transcriptional regulator [Polyangiaceae bacterium]